MQKFCFVCGRRTDKLINGYCEGCHEKKPIVKLKKLSLTVCARCNSIKIGNSWTKNIEDVLKKRIKSVGELERIKVNEEGRQLEILLEIRYQGKIKREAHIVEFNKIKALCKKCLRDITGYYEAVLQLREFEENELPKKFLNAFRYKHVKGGIDFYIESKSVARSIAKKIQKMFSVETKESFKIKGRKDGKNIYRNFILIRKIKKR